MIDPNKLLPATYRYAKLLLEKIVADSREVNAEELIQYGFPPGDLDKVIIFEGYIQECAKHVGLSIGTQNKAMQILNAIRATTLLRHGGPRVKAIYIINYVPTDEQYLEFKSENEKYSLRTMPRKDELYSRDMAELRTRIQSLEEKVEFLEKEFIDFKDKRLFGQ